MNIFDFSLKTKVKFGCGVSKYILNILKAESWNHVGLVYDHNLIQNQDVDSLIHSLGKSDRLIKAECTISEPTYDSLDNVRGQFNDPDLQVIIGIGGGSALDMAKAMAVLVHNKKPAIDYRGFDKMTELVLPIIAVPTTAGTGSEVTPNASFIDSQAKKKLGINGEAVRPTYAFLDPELTLSCPKGPTISAGVDSLVHAVEAFAAKKSNRMARFFAKEGFLRVFETLPLLVDDLDNVLLREEVMFGAFLSGIALMHSGTGPAAAMSYPMSVHYHVPHGLGGGIFLPYVIDHNIRAGYTGYADLYNPNKLETNLAQELLLTELRECWEKFQITHNLSKLGVKQADIGFITDETMQLKGALDQNPTPFYEKEIANILNMLTEG
ncbi:MAG: iron-containing alcohol dehydrogenase [Deltaproteobacteria bacterium]|nr:iron-containing alcohol dehydrogenase [Deltaproteobacteria bacterium]